jgi:hypothetical protein
MRDGWVLQTAHAPCSDAPHFTGLLCLTLHNLLLVFVVVVHARCSFGCCGCTVRVPVSHSELEMLHLTLEV